MTSLNKLLASYTLRLGEVLSPKRVAHSQRVSQLAREVAEHWGLDMEKAQIAGLLHDVARDLPQDILLQTAREKALKIGPEEINNPILLHAPLGAALLKEGWGIEDPEILLAVAGHTLATPQMTDLTKILYLCDNCEPARRYPEADAIRALLKKDLNQAMALSLRSTLKWLEDKTIDLHPATRQAYEYFSKQKEESALETQQFLEKCTALAKEKKAEGIISLYMKDLTSITDYFLIMTAGNTRLAKALSDYIREEFKEQGLPVSRVEGYKDGRWILMDYGFLIIHIFQEEERQYYNLERIWGDAPKLEY